MKHRSMFFGFFTALFIFFYTGVSAQRSSSKRVILVLDATYTMQQNNSMEIAKSWAIQAIDHFNTGDSLCIITFDNYAKVLVPFLPVQNRNFMLRTVANISPRLGTYIYDGLSLALKAHNWRNAGQTRRSVIVLITDGLAPNDNRLEAIASEIDSANCVLHVVQTISTDGDYENQLKILQKKGGGELRLGSKKGLNSSTEVSSLPLVDRPERIIQLIRN